MATPPALREQRREPLSQIPFHKIEGSLYIENFELCQDIFSRPIQGIKNVFCSFWWLMTKVCNHINMM
jgi:hypothetical protein